MIEYDRYSAKGTLKVAIMVIKHLEIMKMKKSRKNRELFCVKEAKIIVAFNY